MPSTSSEPSIIQQAALLWKNQEYPALIKLLDSQQQNIDTFIPLWSCMLRPDSSDEDISRFESLLQLYIYKKSLNIDSFYYLLTLDANLAVIKIYMNGIKSKAIIPDLFDRLTFMVNEKAKDYPGLPFIENVSCMKVITGLSRIAQKFSQDSCEYAACKNAAYNIMQNNETWVEKKKLFMDNKNTLLSFSMQQITELMINPRYSIDSLQAWVALQLKFITLPKLMLKYLTATLVWMFSLVTETLKFIILGEEFKPVSSTQPQSHTKMEEDLSAILIKEALKEHPDLAHIENLYTLYDQGVYQLTPEDLQFLNPRTYERDRYRLAITTRNVALIQKIGLVMPTDQEKTTFELKTFEECARFSLARRAQRSAFKQELKTNTTHILPIRIAANRLTTKATRCDITTLTNGLATINSTEGKPDPQQSVDTLFQFIALEKKPVVTSDKPTFISEEAVGNSLAADYSQPISRIVMNKIYKPNTKSNRVNHKKVDSIPSGLLSHDPKNPSIHRRFNSCHNKLPDETIETAVWERNWRSLPCSAQVSPAIYANRMEIY